MIKVSGRAVLNTGFEVELDMTEEEFDALSERQQNEMLENAINWRTALEDCETDEIEVWDIEELDEIETE